MSTAEAITDRESVDLVTVARTVEKIKTITRIDIFKAENRLPFPLDGEINSNTLYIMDVKDRFVPDSK